MEEKVIVNNKDKEVKRVMFIDIAKGIAILLMIVGHAINHGLLRNTIFSFHLPLFIITNVYRLYTWIKWLLVTMEFRCCIC